MTRKRQALLTKTNREFLPNQGEYYQNNAPQNRDDAFRGIRERLEHSIKDFTILFEHLPENQRERVFGDTRDTIEDPELRDGARDALAFLLRETGVMVDILPGNNQQTEAERLLIDALQRVADQHTTHRLVDSLEFEIESLPVDVEMAREKVRKGEELTAAETHVLLDRGYAELKLNE